MIRDDLVNRFNLEGSFNAALDGAYGLANLQIDGRTYVYAASQNSDRIDVYELLTDGRLAFVQEIVNAAATPLDGVAQLAAVSIAGQNYLYAVSSFSDSVVAFSVGPQGTLAQIDAVRDTDNGAFQLDGAEGVLFTRAGGNNFLVASGTLEDGISVFRIESNGTLTNTANYNDASNSGFRLNGAMGMTDVRFPNTAYVVVAGSVEDGISVFRIDANGQLTLTDSAIDDFNTYLNGATDVASVTVGSARYVVVTGSDDYGLSVFRVSGTGMLTNVFNLADNAQLGLSGAYSVEPLTIGGEAYVAVAAEFDDALSYFKVNADGSLTAVDAAFDVFGSQENLQLDGARGLTVAEVGGLQFVIGSGYADDGLSVFEVGVEKIDIVGTNGADYLQGTDLDDTILGLRGNDVISAGRDDDTVNGGPGSDIISGGDGNDKLSGDGDFTQTGFDQKTVPSTGQDLSLSVTLPDGSTSSTIEISGFISRQQVTASDFNVVYIIDVSGSMGDPFTGAESVGDLNGDGSANTLIDGTILAFESLNQSLVNAGLAASDLTIIPFETSAYVAFDGTVGAGVSSALRTLDSAGNTNYEQALQQAIAVLRNAGAGENRIFFISDGFNTGGTFTDEVATLLDQNGINAEIRAIGLGSGASLSDLDLVDDGIANNSAERVVEPSALQAGLTSSDVDLSEIDRLEVLVNGVVRSTLTPDQFEVTPFGLRYDTSVAGLSTSAGDTVTVRLVASDPAMTTVSVALTIPNVPDASGNDVIEGGAGNDTVVGNGGDDRLFGGEGDDGLSGGLGADVLYGDEGNDVLSGGSGDDFLFGGLGDDTLNGDGGDDIIDPGTGANIVNGGTGTDTLTYAASRAGVIANLGTNFALSTRDQIFNVENLTGSDFADMLFGNGDRNRIDGGAGDDILLGRLGDDRLDGGAGNDELFGEGGNDTILGGDGHDILSGGDGVDFLNGGAGNDTIYGGAGSETTIVGGDGDDLISAGSGNDTGIEGREGNDTIYGGAGADSASGGTGDDIVSGGSGNDTLFGGDGNDRVIGGANDDLLYGDAGNDNLAGGIGDDRLLGGAGNDVLTGSSGNDTLIGGPGNDLLSGGTGADTFTFQPGYGRDTVNGFEDNVDELRLNSDLWAGAGNLTPAQVIANFATQISPGVIEFDFGNGNVLVVSNGGGISLSQLENDIGIF